MYNIAPSLGGGKGTSLIEKKHETVSHTKLSGKITQKATTSVKRKLGDLNGLADSNVFATLLNTGLWV